MNSQKPIRAKKSLGQNFLKNKRILREMIRAGEIHPGETVIEIGPGKGSLTSMLLEEGIRVIAIEKDHRLIPHLEELFKSHIENTTLTLIHDDILTCTIDSYTEGPYTVIANIPYYITGAIISHFLELPHQPKKMVLMIQHEVAKRIVARDLKESILSLSVKVFSTPRIIEKVSKKEFSPVPKVDSAIIALSDIHNPFQNSKQKENFFYLIKKAFGQKRKIVGNTLKEIGSELLQKAHIQPNDRPEDITLESWISLSHLYPRE